MKISPVQLLLFATFLKGMAWASIVPIWHFPDEQAHFAQVNYFAQESKMPKGPGFDLSKEIFISEQYLGTERDGQGNNKFTYHPQYKIDYTNSRTGKSEFEIANLPKSFKSEFVKREATHNPGLYYMLAFPFYKFVDGQSLFARVISVRFLSVILATLTVFVVFKISQLIFEKNKVFQIALPALVSFQPMFTFSTSGVLPDSLVFLLFSLFIYLTLLVLKNGWTMSRIFWLTLILIGGFFTRQNFPIILIFLPFVGLITFIKSSQKINFLMGIIVSLIGLLILSFFVPVLRSIHTFEFPEVATKTINNVSFLTHLKFSIKQTIAQTIPWYWGVFDWLGVVLPRIVNQIINRIMIIAFIGVLIRLFMILGNRKIVKLNLQKRINFEEIIFFYLGYVSLVYFAVLIFWDFLFVRTHGFSFGIQGRYFLPTIVAHMYLIIIGISIFKWKKIQNYLVFGLSLAMIVLNTIALYTVSKTYFDVSNFRTFFIQASQYKPLFFKSPNLEIIIFTYFGFLLLFIVLFFRQVLRYEKKS